MAVRILNGRFGFNTFPSFSPLQRTSICIHRHRPLVITSISHPHLPLPLTRINPALAPVSSSLSHPYHPQPRTRINLRLALVLSLNEIPARTEKKRLPEA
ncbi:MAG: hypothetical protein J6M19_07000 [Bacteroidaceae bacterium]|nr:hypothetical protein [Bacteroidaceae bacterium]